MKSRIKQVEALREQIRARQAERAAFEAQPLARDEVRQKVAATVSEWEAEALRRNALNLRLLAGGDRPSLVEFSADKSVGPLLVLMVGAERVQQVLLAGIEAVPDGMATADREARTISIDSELDALEGEEEILIVQAEGAGEFIVRRGDARPEIVLGNRDPMPEVRSPHYAGLGEVPASPRRRAAVYSTYVGSSRP